MTVHPIHRAVVSRLEPLFEVGFVFVKIDAGKSNVLKPELAGPCLNGLNDCSVVTVIHTNSVTDMSSSAVHSAHD